jgi:hypothetical protein
MQAARRYFGSWSKAVIAAGVDPLKLRRVVPWTKERIIEAILTRTLNNEPLGSRSVQPRSLADAGAKVFGTWAAALEAAGVDAKLTVRKFLGEQHEDGHASVAPPGEPNEHLSLRPRSPDLLSPFAAHTHARPWSKPKVLEAILARLHSGQAMNAKAVYREDRPMYRAATRRFGNWSHALFSAGLDPNQFSKRGTVRI